MIYKIRSLYKFCDQHSNYHKLTGSLPGETNANIKEQMQNFSKLYKDLDPKQLKEQQLKQMYIKFSQQNAEALKIANTMSTETPQSARPSFKGNRYLQFMAIFGVGMLLFLLKETYRFYYYPKNIVLYDENTGRTYQTTKEEFEKIKRDSKKNKEFTEFRIKVLSKQQAQQFSPQPGQMGKITKEEGLI